MSMIWPIALVVISNVVYQICAKGVPKDMDAMASMTITYIVGAVCSAVMYFVMNRHGNLLQEYSKMNWAPIFLGISVVGLEVGFIYAYKNGWAVSTASIVQSAFLAVALLFVGALLYHEAINASKIIGVVQTHSATLLTEQLQCKTNISAESFKSLPTPKALTTS